MMHVGSDRGYHPLRGTRLTRPLLHLSASPLGRMLPYLAGMTSCTSRHRPSPPCPPCRRRRLSKPDRCPPPPSAMCCRVRRRRRDRISHLGRVLLAEDGFYNPGNYLHSNEYNQVRLARHTIVSICDSPNHTPESRVPELQSPIPNVPESCPKLVVGKEEEKAGAVLRTAPIPARIPLWCPNGTVRYTSGIAPRNT